MMTGMNTEKVAISLPASLAAWVDEERQRRGLSRSGFIAGLLDEERRRLADEELAARFAAAYAEQPETDDEAWISDAGAATAAAVAAEDPHDWAADYEADRALRAAG